MLLLLGLIVKELAVKTLKKQDKSFDISEIWCWEWLLNILWIAKKTNHGNIEQINSKFSLEAKMIKHKLSYFRHIIPRPSSLEKVSHWKRWKDRENDGQQKDGFYYSTDNCTIGKPESQIRNRSLWRKSICVVTKSRQWFDVM